MKTQTHKKYEYIHKSPSNWTSGRDISNFPRMKKNKTWSLLIDWHDCLRNSSNSHMSSQKKGHTSAELINKLAITQSGREMSHSFVVKNANLLLPLSVYYLHAIAADSCQFLRLDPAVAAVRSHSHHVAMIVVRQSKKKLLTHVSQNHARKINMGDKYFDLANVNSREITIICESLI